VSAAIATIDEAAWVDIPGAALSAHCAAPPATHGWPRRGFGRRLGNLTSDATEAGKTALVNVYE